MATVTKKTTTPVKKTIAKKTVVKKATAAKVATPVVFKECVYTDKNIQISPRKLRLLANTIKKYEPSKVVARLQFTNTKSARVLIKAVKTAIATAKNNYQIVPETMKFSEIRVDEGTKIKRMDKSHGSRFARVLIMRRHSLLTIIIKGQVK
jgi:large subunit ribosomal protein L22